MNKFAKFALVSSFSLLLMTACSSAGKENITEVQKESSEVKKRSSDVVIKILEGEFIAPPDAVKLSNTDFIAVKVQVENNTDGSLAIVSDNFTLYDNSNEFLEPKVIYDNTNTINDLKNISLSNGKSAVGYLFYEIKKGVTNYEMKLATHVRGENNQDIEVSIDFNTDDFVDNRESSLDLAKSYVNNVFLDGHKQTNMVDFALANDLKKDRDDFLNEFVSSFDLLFSTVFKYYHPSEKELTDLALSYISENSKKAEVTYNLVSYLPDVVTVGIKPKILDSDSIDVNALMTDYLGSKGSVNAVNYLSSQEEAEKYVFSQLKVHLSDASLKEPVGMPNEGYLLTFVKDGDEWILDKNAPYNLAYDDLAKTFAGF